MSTVFRLLLLAGLLVCAVATARVKKPLRRIDRIDRDADVEETQGEEEPHEENEATR